MKVDEEDEGDDEDLSRAGISTRGMNRRGDKKDDTFNEDLNITQVPQVSILDTDGKNVLRDDEDSDEEQQANATNADHLSQYQQDGFTRPASADSREVEV